MAEGIEVVKQAIARDFGSVKIDEAPNFDTKGTTLRFTSENRPFVVEVSYEFDEDFGSGQIVIDLRELGAILRASANGRADVTRDGISLRSAA
jgi:hypothetical protein